MIRVFLDANILVTVLCNEYPRFGPCVRVLSLVDDPRFEVYTSPLCMAIGAYYAGKKNGKKNGNGDGSADAAKVKEKDQKNDREKQQAGKVKDPAP